MSETTVFEKLHILKNDIYARFDDQQVYIDRSFSEFKLEINHRFDDQRRHIDATISDVKSELKVGINYLRNILLNANASSRWSNIHPVPREEHTKHGLVYKFPSYFPNKTVKFWHLRSPSKCQRQKFIRLLEFYDIFKDDKLEVPLAQYVKGHLDEAHARLATAWNLPYRKLQVEMQRAVKEGHMARAKRAHQLSDDDDEVEVEVEVGVGVGAEVPSKKRVRWAPSTASQTSGEGKRMPWHGRPGSSGAVSSIVTSTSITKQIQDLQPTRKEPAQSENPTATVSQSSDESETAVASRTIARSQNLSALSSARSEQLNQFDLTGTLLADSQLSPTQRLSMSKSP